MPLADGRQLFPAGAGGREAEAASAPWSRSPHDAERATNRATLDYFGREHELLRPVADLLAGLGPADREARFNGKLESECLNTHWLLSLDDAQQKLEHWRRDYNKVRPHSAIG